MTKTWVLVADASRARLLSADAELTSFETREGFIEPKARMRDREVMADRPGTTRVGPGMYAGMEPPSRRDEVDRAFAKELVERLDMDRAAGLFDHLVVVAPPRFLGALRAAMGPHLTRLVAAEVGRDYSAVPDHELGAALAPHLEGTVLR